MEPTPIPFTIIEGNITALKIGSEIITTPPIPFENFRHVTKDVMDFVASQEEYNGLDTAYKIMSRRLEEAKQNKDEAQIRLDTARTRFEIALVRASNGNGASPHIPPVEQPQPKKIDPKPEIRIQEPIQQNEPDQIPRITLESIMEERQADIDSKINEQLGVPPATGDARIILPPEPQPDKTGSQEWFLGKVNIPVWVDEHENEIYEILQKTPEFKEDDVKKILTNMEIPADQIDGITTELLQRIEKNNMASPITAKGIADRIYDSILGTVPDSFTDNELKEAIRAQGIAEEYIEETTQEIIRRIPKPDKAPGFIEKVKKLTSKKPGKKK